MKSRVKGFEKMRRVRRRPLPPTHEPSDDDGPPGINPSTDDDCPASDELDSEIEKVEIRTGRIRRSRRAIQRVDSGGDSSEESCTGNTSSNVYNHRTVFRPSMIEETAMLTTGQMQPAIDSRNGFNHQPPIGSVGRLLSITDDNIQKGSLASRNLESVQPGTDGNKSLAGDPAQRHQCS